MKGNSYQIKVSNDNGAELNIFVHSHDTVLDLKKKINHMGGMAAFFQILSFKG